MIKTLTYEDVDYVLLNIEAEIRAKGCFEEKAAFQSYMETRENLKDKAAEALFRNFLRIQISFEVAIREYIALTAGASSQCDLYKYNFQFKLDELERMVSEHILNVDGDFYDELKKLIPTMDAIVDLTERIKTFSDSYKWECEES